MPFQREEPVVMPKLQSESAIFLRQIAPADPRGIADDVVKLPNIDRCKGVFDVMRPDAVAVFVVQFLDLGVDVHKVFLLRCG